MRSIPGAAATGLAASLCASITAAQTSFSTGDSEDIRFQWGVPEASASSGSGSVYFQLDAPGSYSWVGLGIGSSMMGSQIFVMYQDGDGNVTLSHRDGEGHQMPQYSARPGIALIEGSGVSGGRMMANVRCSDCESLDMGGENSWIAAWKSGEPLDSTNPREPIDIHDSMNVFSVDFSQASISSDANPFLDPSNDSGDDGGAVTEEGGDTNDTIILAHGVIMTIVFVVLYPLGSMLMPLLGKWFVHAGTQIVAFLLMWAGFACGFVYANDAGVAFQETHHTLGTVVVALLGVQPVLGYLHHLHFVKHRRRGVISHIHIWYGRILMVIGIINGGFGLKLAGNTSGGFVIAYSVVAAILAVAYLGSIAFGLMKRRRNTLQEKSSPTSESRPSQ